MQTSPFRLKRIVGSCFNWFQYTKLKKICHNKDVNDCYGFVNTKSESACSALTGKRWLKGSLSHLFATKHEVLQEQ